MAEAVIDLNVCCETHTHTVSEAPPVSLLQKVWKLLKHQKHSEMSVCVSQWDDCVCHSEMSVCVAVRWEMSVCVCLCRSSSTWIRCVSLWFGWRWFLWRRSRLPHPLKNITRQLRAHTHLQYYKLSSKYHFKYNKSVETF